MLPIFRSSLLAVGALALVACSTDEHQDRRTTATAPVVGDGSDGVDADETSMSLKSSSTSSACLTDLTGKPNAQAICAKIAEMQAKYKGRDITVAAIGALSAGGLGGYVVYDTSDLQAGGIRAVAPLESQEYASETAAWSDYGVAGVGLYVRDASQPPQEGYAYAAMGYGPTGGVVTVKVSTPKRGTQTLLIPFAW